MTYNQSTSKSDSNINCCTNASEVHNYYLDPDPTQKLKKEIVHAPLQKLERLSAILTGRSVSEETKNLISNASVKEKSEKENIASKPQLLKKFTALNKCKIIALNKEVNQRGAAEGESPCPNNSNNQTEEQAFGAAEHIPIENEVAKHTSSKPIRPVCKVCRVSTVNGILPCGGCDLEWYCSFRHLQQDWKSHREHCSPMTRISASKVLVASIALKEGSIIICEQSYLSIPDPGVIFEGSYWEQMESYQYLQQITDRKVLCVGCCIDLSPCSLFGTEFHCQICSAPICSDTCLKLSAHSDYECKILHKIRKCSETKELLESDQVIGQIFYDFIAVIRILLMKERDPRGWLFFLEQSFDIDLIRNGVFSGHIQYQDKLKLLIRLFGSLKHECFQFTSDNELQISMEEHCFRALNVFKRRGIGHQLESIFLIRTFGPKVSFIEHSCVPNVDIAVSMNGRITVKAIRDIGDKEQLFASFVNSLRPTYDRRLALQIQRLFDCRCERCSDNTEFGTYFGSIKCNRHECCTGYLVCENPLAAGIPSESLQWKCYSCGFSAVHSYIIKKNEELVSLIFDMSSAEKKSITYMEPVLLKILTEKQSSFHSNHWLIIYMKKILGEMYSLEWRTWNYKFNEYEFRRKAYLSQEVTGVLAQLRLRFSRDTAEINHEIFELRVLLKRTESDTVLRNLSSMFKEELLDLGKEAFEIWRFVNHYDPNTHLGNASGTAYNILKLSNIDVYRIG